MATGPTERVALLPELTEAELLTVPQLAEVVGEEIWTDRLPPLAREVPEPPQVRMPELVAQVQPAETEPEVQVNEPGVEGRVSVIVTFVAVPGAALETCMSKPMLDPALTGEAGLAFLVTNRLGHWTVTEAEACLCGLLVAVAVAVLL